MFGSRFYWKWFSPLFTRNRRFYQKFTLSNRRYNINCIKMNWLLISLPLNARKKLNKLFLLLEKPHENNNYKQSFSGHESKSRLIRLGKNTAADICRCYVIHLKTFESRKIINIKSSISIFMAPTTMYLLIFLKRFIWKKYGNCNQQFKLCDIFCTIYFSHPSFAFIFKYWTLSMHM